MLRIARARRALVDRWPRLRPERWTLGRLEAALDEAWPAVDRVAEVTLVHGCVEGDNAALRVLERDYLIPLERTLCGRGFAQSTAADAMQQVRLNLLVDRGQGVPLLHYRGRGPLATWLRTACLREAIRQRKREQTAARRDEPAAGPPSEAHSACPSEAAEIVGRLREILSTLTARDRDLLRARYYGGLRLEQLAETYGVHASTVARWLARTELRIQSELRRVVCADLRLCPSACESLLRGTRRHPAFGLSLVLRRTLEGSEISSAFAP